MHGYKMGAVVPRLTKATPKHSHLYKLRVLINLSSPGFFYAVPFMKISLDVISFKLERANHHNIELRYVWSQFHYPYSIFFFLLNITLVCFFFHKKYIQTVTRDVLLTSSMSVLDEKNNDLLEMGIFV